MTNNGLEPLPEPGSTRRTGPPLVPPNGPEVMPPPAPLSPTAMILLMVSTVAALYFGRDVLIPLTLAILLSFALGPLVTWLTRHRMPRIPAVITVVGLVLIVLAGIATIMATQFLSLAMELPRYEMNLRTKAQLLASVMPGGSVLERTADMLRQVGEEIEKNTQGAVGGSASGPLGREDKPPSRPIPVEVHQPPPTPAQALMQFVGPLLTPLATAGVVLVFVVFVLLQRGDLRDRLIRLWGSRDVHRTTEAINDAGKRIGRYLLMQLVINVLYGLPVGIGLYLIGVPNALLWGLLATVLRFIPYLGPILAAILPIALSLAVDPGWTKPLLTIALFISLELFSNNVMEPWLYGSSTGLSPLAIIVGAVFWTTLWGPIGLLLATPLTACLVVLGRHVPQLQFFWVLLGDEPVLSPELKFYQRLLAGDPEEAREIAMDAAEERPLAEVYETIILPALIFGDRDRHRRALSRERAGMVAGWALDIVNELAEDHPAMAEDRSPKTRVLCVGTRNGFDQAAATMLAHLLCEVGLAAETMAAPTALRSDQGNGGYDVVCLSLVDPNCIRHARRLGSRIRARRGPSGLLCVGLWGLPSEKAEEAAAATGADLVVWSLSQAVTQIQAAIDQNGKAASLPQAALQV